MANEIENSTFSFADKEGEMRPSFPRFHLSVLFPVLLSVAVAAQELPQRDPQAILLLSQSVAAMGGNAPNSSVATGTIDIVEGSLKETGRIRIVTRGLSETREEIQTPRGVRGRVFSKGFAARISSSRNGSTSQELAASSQSTSFPLPLLAAAVINPDFAFEYVGQEVLDGITVHHIRFWNTYASQPDWQTVSEFTRKDIWIDASTGFPRKILYEEREAGGAADRIVVGAVYGDFRNQNGFYYPFKITRILNGTPWAKITIEQVLVAESLADSEFAIQ